MYVGILLDRRNGTGIVWTAAFLFVGAALGSWLAWKAMHEA